MSNNKEGIIYHSDDMGATLSITTRLIEAWERGLLDGFSIFADSAYLTDIQKSLCGAPNKAARIAIHLNLWEGKSLLPASEVPSLVDRDGYFRVGFIDILKRYMLGSGKQKNALIGEVEREWDAQIKKVVDSVKPRAISALDGHVHIHMLPFLFKIAARLAKKYGIPEIRMVAEPYHFSRKFSECLSIDFIKNMVKHMVLSVCVHFDARIAREMGVGHPEAMIGILYSGMMSEANVVSGINAAMKKRFKKIEVLMHIGRASETELARWKGDRKKACFVLSPRRDVEYKELACLRKNKNA